MAYSKGRGGTIHHEIHTWTGWGVILGLPSAIWSALAAIQDGSDGFALWLGSPLGALGFLAFATAAVWYCKLEMDEVVMDYAGEGARGFALFCNKAVALILWATIAFSVVSLAFF